MVGGPDGAAEPRAPSSSLGRHLASDRLCDRFEAAWGAGDRPRIEDYLAGVPAAERAGLLRDLVRLERELIRASGGEGAESAAYLERFPDDSALREVLAPGVGGGAGGDSTRPLAEGLGEFTGTERFAPIRRLGAGGMGVVYEVEDLGRGSRTALKLLPVIAPLALLRFKEEFRSLAELAHPNLVRLDELFHDAGRWFFTMELIEGGDFLDHVRGGPADEGPLRAALRQLAEGLDFLHGAGKVHRDLKPSNVMVDGDGRLVILDLGLVVDLAGRPAGGERPGGPRDEGRVTLDQGAVVGTAAYMAPEQVECRPPAPACDWYAVGAMLYEALTGRPPFVGPVLEVLRAKLERDPVPPGRVVEGAPADLEALCLELLARDPTRRPGGEEVLARLGAAAAAAEGDGREPGPRGEPAFVGRRELLAGLRGAWDAARAGRPALALVSGESGAGKSALVRRFLAELAGGGRPPTVLAGRCLEQELIPFKAVDGLMDQLSGAIVRMDRATAEALLPAGFPALVRMFPVLGRAAPRAAGRDAPGAEDPREVRRLAFAALGELLGRLAERGPLVVWIDDLQWGDLDSALLLNSLFEGDRPPRLLLIASYRSESSESTPCLRVLGERRDVIADRFDLPVGELPRADSLELAAALLPGAGAGRVEAVATQARGNAYLLAELARDLRESPHGRDEWAGLGLDDLLWRRSRAQADVSRDYLGTIAVAGSPVTRRLVRGAAAAAAGGDDQAAWRALRLARLIRTLGPGPDDRVEVFHDRVREAILARLPADELRARHLGLARALEAEGAADDEAIAVHLEGGGEPDRAGARFAAAAEASSRSLAFDHAARLYRRSLALRPLEGRDRSLVRGRLAEALAAAGRGPEAAAEYREAGRDSGPAEAARARIHAFRAYMTSGHTDEAYGLLPEMVRFGGTSWPGGPRRALAGLVAKRLRLAPRVGRLLRDRAVDDAAPAGAAERLEVLWTLSTYLFSFDPVRGAWFLADHLLLALRSGSAREVIRGLCTDAIMQSGVGPAARPRSEALLDLCSELAASLPDDPYTRGILEASRGHVAFFVGDYRGAIGPFEEAERTLRSGAVGLAFEVGTVAEYRLRTLLALGRFREFRERLPALLRDAEERNDLRLMMNLGTDLWALHRLAAADVEGAERVPARIARSWTHPGTSIQVINRAAGVVLMALYRGDARAAWDHVVARWPGFERSLYNRSQQILVELLQLRGRAALALAATLPRREPGRRALLRTAATAAGRLLKQATSEARGHGHYLRAAAGALGDDPSRATEGLEAAARAYEEGGMLLYAQAARRRLGERLGGTAGAALVAAADAWMIDQSIRDPEAMTRMLAPA